MECQLAAKNNYECPPPGMRLQSGSLAVMKKSPYQPPSPEVKPCRPAICFTKTADQPPRTRSKAPAETPAHLVWWELIFVTSTSTQLARGLCAGGCTEIRMTNVDWTIGSICVRDCRVDRHHVITLSNIQTHNVPFQTSDVTTTC